MPGRTSSEKLLMVFTDAEMPEMDGYRLTTEIRSDARLRKLYVVLHTSLSGSFNESMVKKVGCDNFLPSSSLIAWSMWSSSACCWIPATRDPAAGQV
jgi:CheW protein